MPGVQGTRGAVGRVVPLRRWATRGGHFDRAMLYGAEMTPHQTQHFLDGSRAERRHPGGPWEVKRGPSNGTGDRENCAAGRFVATQNRWVLDSHQAAVAAVRGRKGREWAA